MDLGGGGPPRPPDAMNPRSTAFKRHDSGFMRIGRAQCRKCQCAMTPCRHDPSLSTIPPCSSGWHHLRHSRAAQIRPSPHGDRARSGRAGLGPPPVPGPIRTITA